MPKRTHLRQQEIQLMILAALTRDNTRGEMNSPKTAAELCKEIGVKKSSLYYALRPMIQGIAIGSVGCEIEINNKGRIVHKFRSEPEKSKAFLIPGPQPNRLLIVDKKNRRAGLQPYKRVKREKGKGSKYYAKPYGRVKWLN